MTKQDIIDYATTTPGNTNKAVLSGMLDSMKGQNETNQSCPIVIANPNVDFQVPTVDDISTTDINTGTSGIEDGAFTQQNCYIYDYPEPPFLLYLVYGTAYLLITTMNIRTLKQAGDDINSEGAGLGLANDSECIVFPIGSNTGMCLFKPSVEFIRVGENPK